MRKLILTYLAILLIVGIALSLADQKSEYKAERALWTINEHFADIAKDPKTIPDATFNSVIKEYENFIKKYSYARITPAAKIYLGRVYLVKENFDKAREVFEKIVQEYKDNSEVAVQALVDIGQSYVIQKDDANLLKVYQRIEKEYPLTNLGIHTPLLIAQLHTSHNDLTSANKALDEAANYYKDLAAKYPKSQIEVISLRLLGTSYLAKRQWTDAVQTFMDVLSRYPTGQNAQETRSIIRTINTVSLVQLKNFDLPIEFYEKFIADHPKHPYNPTFEKVVARIKELKEKAQQQKQQPKKQEASK
jgi:TolA-binding protein